MLDCIKNYSPQMEDKKSSVHYYMETVKQDYSKAQLWLGKKYYFGQDLKQDIMKSIYYLELAKNKSHDARFYLGVIYSDGRYQKTDIDKAISYFKGASSFNDQYSKNNLGVLYKRYKNIKAAITYFKEAIRQKDDLFSKFNLALIYLNEDPNDQYTEEIIEYLAITDKKYTKGFFSCEFKCQIIFKIFLFYFYKKILFYQGWDSGKGNFREIRLKNPGKIFWNNIYMIIKKGFN